jgi:hypothetical protein
VLLHARFRSRAIVCVSLARTFALMKQRPRARNDPHQG